VLRAAFPPGTPGRVRQRRAVGIGEVTGPGVPRARVRRTGDVASSCGDLAGTVGGSPVRLRVRASVRDLDAGRPLRFEPCGAVALPAGSTRLSMPAGTFAPYLLRLRSPGAGAAAASPGRVVDAGRPSRDAWKDVELDLHAPAWLILGESYSDGWRATCDGHDLGAPQPVDGYAMGWRVPASCRTASMTFGPDRLVRAGYLVSLPVLAGLVLLLLFRRPPKPAPLPPPLPEPRSAPLPAGRAALLALAAGAVLGFVIAARAAPLIALATFFVLWRGVGVRALVAAASGLLVVVLPVLTLAIGVEDRGGYNPEYAQDRIAAHWVVAAAVVLLTLALARVLGAARRRRSPA
jgi:arabinofuranan 3-O-arabinosyltransferase